MFYVYLIAFLVAYISLFVLLVNILVLAKKNVVEPNIKQ